jgi:hypothetical protein
MDARGWRRVEIAVGVAFGVIARVAVANAPAAGFTSLDQRLPNPDRPYEMTGGTVNFDVPPFFGLYDLEFEPTQPAQLDIPLRTEGGTLAFDSEFDIAYRAWISFGLGPVHEVSGTGKAHVVGEALAGDVFEPQVFATELKALDLYGLSAIPEVYFRESPTLASTGVIIREDTCPPCLGPVTQWRIGSVIDVNGEFSYDGGHTWAPGEKSFRIEQPPGPGLAGDYNEDGRVDAADYVIVRSGMGETYSSFDLAWWRANFGDAAERDFAVGTPSVREPATLFLMLGGCAALACLWRRLA